MPATPRRTPTLVLVLVLVLGLTVGCGEVDVTAPTTVATIPEESLVVFGDAADCRTPASEVASLVAELPGEIVVVGDVAYPDGSAEALAECFAPLYGDQLDRLWAVPGDNDYGTGTADPLWDVLGDRAGARGEGWWSFDHGAWQIIGLNAQCEQVGGCDDQSAQYAWLAELLAATPDQTCRLAAWHLPRFTSSANYDEIPRLGPMYELLLEAGTDVLVVGNSHHYERFERLGADGRPEAEGIRNFTVGIGGAPFTEFGEPRPGSVVRSNTTRGALVFVLADGSYRWRLEAVPADDAITDAGSDTC